MRFLSINIRPLPLCLMLSSIPAFAGHLDDRDRDGLDDRLEQEILERFRPFLRIDANECDRLPAEFQPDRDEPLPIDFNGTLYGQVFPVAPQGRSGSLVEVHYYHLWANDCGRFGHRLDTEYVSGLLSFDAFEETTAHGKALFWFAAAHEGTLCDMSNAAAAEAVGAVEKGPEIWVSQGKHASFLSLEVCQRVGCGGDRCGEMEPMPSGRIINLGEPGYPLNGARWTRSGAWSLWAKMASDFDDSRLDRFEAVQEVSVIGGAPHPTRPILLAGNKTIGAMETTHVETGEALVEAGSQTAGAVGKSLGAVGRSLRTVGRFLFGRRSTEEKRD